MTVRLSNLTETNASIIADFLAAQIATGLRIDRSRVTVEAQGVDALGQVPSVANFTVIISDVPGLPAGMITIPVGVESVGPDGPRPNRTVTELARPENVGTVQIFLMEADECESAPARQTCSPNVPLCMCVCFVRARSLVFEVPLSCI